jgi:ethanolamine utilization protein EutQ
MRRLRSILTVAMALCVITPHLAISDTPKPLKITASEAAGPIFKGPKATSEDGGPDGPTKDAGILESADKRFVAGLYQAGAADYPIDAYPVDEFCYFVAGGVKLISADGTVLEVKAGEAVSLPKGWKGRWQTTGYIKYYVIYDSASKVK